MENEQPKDQIKFPGVFVTRKKKTTKFAETATTLCFPFSFADDDSDIEWEKDAGDNVQAFVHRQTESPWSELGSEQCLSECTSLSNGPNVKEQKSDTSCQARMQCIAHLQSLAKDGDQDSGTCDSDEKNQKRPKRKKSKDKKPEVNAAVDAVRYKTKMCKNWQLFEKCPYGPRCLFAHGAKELRTYTVNHSAITTAATSESPERQFYAMGHFPSFIPVPFQMEETGSLCPPIENPLETNKLRNTPSPALVPPPPPPPPPPLRASCAPTPAVTTHSPYSPTPAAVLPVPSPSPSPCPSPSPPSPVFASLPTSFPYPCTSCIPHLYSNQPCQPPQDCFPTPLLCPVVCGPVMNCGTVSPPPPPFLGYQAAPPPACPVYVVPQLMQMPSLTCSMQLAMTPQTGYPWQVNSSSCGMMLGADPHVCW